MNLRRAIARRLLGNWYEDPTPHSDNAIVLPEPPWRQRVRGLFLWYRHWRHVHPHYPRQDSARRAWVYRCWLWKPEARKHWVKT
jgi:hypothetical protein